MKTYRISVLVNKAGSKKAAGTISGAARYICKHFGGSSSYSTSHDMHAPDPKKGQVVTILIDGPDNMDDMILAAAVRACSEQYQDTPNGDIIMYGGVRVGVWYTGDEGWSPNGWRPMSCHAGNDFDIEVRHKETGVTKIGRLHYTWGGTPGQKLRDKNEYVFEDGSTMDYRGEHDNDFEYREVR